MSSSKHKEFSTADQEVAVLGTALAHPARLAILRLLALRQPCMCAEIVKSLPLAQSTVSQHLRALQQAGLILGSVDGVRSQYSLARGEVKRLVEKFNAFFNQLEPEGPGS